MMEAAVSTIWWIGIVVGYLAVPVLVVLLVRVLRAALKIEYYACVTRASSQKIASHLELVPVLNITEQGLIGANALANEVAIGAEALTVLLARRAGGTR